VLRPVAALLPLRVAHGRIIACRHWPGDPPA